MIITDKLFLQQKCKDASLFDVPAIIKQLETELEHSNGGIGLSANQIGIKLRIAIIRMGSLSLDLINPIIIKQYNLSEFHSDSCLSFPGDVIITHRFNEIVVQDLFHSAGIVLRGFEAVVAEHELDHINGITMYDRKIIIPRLFDPCWCGSGRKYSRCHSNLKIKA